MIHIQPNTFKFDSGKFAIKKKTCRREFVVIVKFVSKLVGKQKHLKCKKVAWPRKTDKQLKELI